MPCSASKVLTDRDSSKNCDLTADSARWWPTWCLVAVMNLVATTTISVAEAAIATAVLWFQTRSRVSSFSLAARNRGAI